MGNITPLFKWAGGKRKMLPRYEGVFNTKLKPFETFVDMFAGAGIMSLWAYRNKDQYGIKSIIINDINSELIDMYCSIKENFYKFIEVCLVLQEEYFACGEDVSKRKVCYLQWRDLYANNQLEGVVKHATLFCMLKTNFNGIWQSRAADGVYYTPFGNGKEKHNFIDIEALTEFKNMLDMSEIYCGSFEEVAIDFDLSKSFFYADPPYLSSFTKYKHKAGEPNFGPEETGKLVEYLCEKSSRGAIIALSNKQHEFFDGKCEGFSVELFKNIKYTASRKDTEGATSNEILIHNL